MESLIGQYELTLDEKNRMIIPAVVRKMLSPDDHGSLYINLGLNGVPWLYSHARWHEVGESSTDIDHIHFHYGTAFLVEWDKQGRTVIPERILSKTNTGKNVVLVGCKDHLELWNKDAWDKRVESLMHKNTL